MSGIQQLLLGGSAGGYQIERSLRFNSADSAHLSRTPAAAGNRRTWTWSGWVKRGTLGSQDDLFAAYIGSGTTDNQYFALYFDSSGVLRIGGYSTSYLTTTQVFRDPSAWYHIMCVIDTTSATANNRVRFYVNGTEITAFSTRNNPTQNADLGINQAAQHQIGQNGGFGSYYEGYLAEVNFIDGQALTPSSFGQSNPNTGVWEPIRYTGTYGTNGFYLNFSDNSNTTAATLGKDSSGNGNNWTPNNFSVTAGAGNDSLVDTPTSYGTDTGVGGEVRGNYATLNPLQNNGTLSNGNLDFADVGSDGWNNSKGTIGVSSGKFYWEMTATNIVTSVLCASVGGQKEALGQLPGQNDSFGVTYYPDGRLYYNGTSTGAWGSTYANGDIIGIALDMDNGRVWFSKNGTWQASGNPATGANPARSDLKTNDDTWFPMSGTFYAGTTCTFNFGQRPFAYTAPSGFKALCTQNLPTPTIGATSTTQAGKYMNVVLYSGNSSTQNITGVGFAPDAVWLKVRNDAQNHRIFDTVRGASQRLIPSATSAEANTPTELNAFGTDGFTLGSNTDVNGTGFNYVSWNWNAGGSNATNTSGTITSTVRANTTAGFSIVTYTGTGANATVGHGLGVAPSMVIVKHRDATASANNWSVYHSGIDALAYSYALYLNSTAARQLSANFWNNTTPTSTVFTIGSDTNVNQNGKTIVAYCFAPVAGYSAFGSYTGNGSTDGPFVYTGFRPRYFLIKRTDSTGDWWIWDAVRSTYNAANTTLRANLAQAEDTDTTNYNMDFVSNGIKVRATSFTAAGGMNVSGATYIYAAFCESPFKFSLAR